jgi:hypothetical protein
VGAIWNASGRGDSFQSPDEDSFAPKHHGGNEQPGPGGWQQAWVLAAAWREQLGQGDAGVGRGARASRSGRG